MPISSKVEKYKKIYEEKKLKYGKVDNIVFGYVILKLVEKGYRNLVFPDIIKIKELLEKEEIK